MLTMRPRPLAHSNAAAAWQQRNVPFRSTSITRSHSASLISARPVESDDTGRVDQRVQAAETLLAGRYRRRGGLRRRYIQLDGQQIIAVQTARGILQTRSIDIPDRDLRAARQQRLRNRQPEAACPTGDQRPAPGTLNI